MSAEDVGTVEVTREDEVAVVTLRRERKRNALSTHMENELLAALRSPEVQSSRAVVVTGGDTVFSAGADVTELREMTTQAIADYYRGSGVGVRGVRRAAPADRRRHHRLLPWRRARTGACR